MTREQITNIFTDLGQEAPQKGVITALLNAYNQEKSVEIENAKKTANDEAEAKYKDYIKPEDHQKVVEELNLEKGKGALAERKAKYQKANLNIDDEDVLNLIESKLKDSKDFDKDLEDYVKNHPSFVVTGSKKKEEKKEEQQQRVTIGATDSEKDKPSTLDLGSAIDEYYKK